ncbi:MAG: hypothetical protein WB630_06305 [Candidatus Acidiferrales bacterium]
MSEVQSPYWNRPRKTASMLTYEDFRDKIHKVLKGAGPVTWTEIRTIARLPKMFPNKKWVAAHFFTIGYTGRRSINSAMIGESCGERPAAILRLHHS